MGEWLLREHGGGKLRDELLDRELFYTLLKVRVLTEQYRPTTTASGLIAPWATCRRRQRLS